MEIAPIIFRHIAKFRKTKQNFVNIAMVLTGEMKSFRRHGQVKYLELGKTYNGEENGVK